jgi:bacillithiol system protein YtxJ
MSWIKLENISQLQYIKADEGTSVIFKHSTRCSISMMAKKSVDMDLDDLPATVKPYFLDLIAHRDISKGIADIFDVEHESPQLLVIKNGDCILDQSHSGISIEEALEVIG